MQNRETLTNEEQETRVREQRHVLIAGFATGFAIGGIFLAYIVLEAAELL